MPRQNRPRPCRANASPQPVELRPTDSRGQQALSSTHQGGTKEPAIRRYPSKLATTPLPNEVSTLLRQQNQLLTQLVELVHQLASKVESQAEPQGD